MLKPTQATVALLALFAISACHTPLLQRPAHASSFGASARGVIHVAIGVPFRVKAPAATAADIDHFDLRLINVPSGTVAAEGSTRTSHSDFTFVADGTYALEVEAFSASGASISEGGPARSENTVTVASPTVSYSDDSQSLRAVVNLRNATGESLSSAITVNDGLPWNGTPAVTPSTT